MHTSALRSGRAYFSTFIYKQNAEIWAGDGAFQNGKELNLEERNDFRKMTWGIKEL